MNSTRDQNIEKLNELKEKLAEKEKKYNEIAGSLQNTAHELYRRQHGTSDSDDETTSVSVLLEQLSFFQKKLDSKEVLILKNEISDLSKEVKSLQKNLFGHADSDSPSILVKK